MNKLINKGPSIFSVLLLLFYQSFFPMFVLAQEATPSAEPSLSESPHPSSYPSDQGNGTPTPSVWQTNTDGSVTTSAPLILNQTYIAPQNDKVTVTFNKLPPNPGIITIKEVNVSSLNSDDINPVTQTAYDITSDMENGTFEYTLTLPTPTTENVEVKASEDGQNFVTLGGVSPGNNVLTITGLNHFTVFVVVGTIATNHTVTQFDESAAPVVINEFVYNASTEWVELFNRSNSSVNLSGWRLEDGNSLTTDDLDLSGTIPAAGILVFQRNSGWLNNDADTINLKNNQGTIVDQVSYKDTGATIVGAQNVGTVGTGQSVGRTTDGIISGNIWTKYTRPTKGYNNSGTPSFINVGSNFSYDSIRNAVRDIAAGGTVNVTAGSYDEADIEVTKRNVTIRGPGIGSGIQRAVINGSCGDSSPPAMFHLHADGIILKGFEINGSRCQAHGVHIGGASEEFRVAGVTVTQNVIYSSNYGVTISIASSYDRERPNIISENDISQNESAGIHFLSASNNIIRDNKIYKNESYGIRLGDEGSGPSNNNQILNNTIKENRETGIYSGGSSISNVTITGNEVTNNYTGIYLEQITDSLTISGNQVRSHHSHGIYLNTISAATVLIGGTSERDRNTITGNGDDDDGSGIYFGSIRNGSTVNVLGNTVSQNGSSNNDPGIDVFRVTNATLTIGPSNTISSNRGTGINLQFRVAGTVITRNTITGNGGASQTAGIVVRKALGNEAHLNNISGNGVGVQNNDSENVFNAIENWWGSTLGPQGRGADSINGNVRFKPWCLDTNCKNIFTQAPEGSLLRDTSFGIPPGRTLSDTPSLSFLSNSVFNVAHAGGTSNVTVPSGVVINRSDGQNLDVNNLAATDVSLTSLSGLGTGVVANGVLQWGLPNIELTFSQPITLSIFVGTSLNGQTLNVVRSTSGTAGWTSTGIVAPGTCVVTNGLCTFQATNASYFATTRTVTPSPTPTPTPSPTSSTSSSSSSSSGGGESASAPSCNDAAAGGAPTLLLALVGGANQVILNWSKASDPLTHYVITYGLSSGAQQYGNPNVGGKDTTSYTVSNLSGGTTYYFRVRAGHGCNGGPYSNELSAAPGGVVLTGSAAGFAPGVLAVSSETGNVGVGEEKVLGETAPSTTQQPVSQQVPGSKPSNKGLVTVIVIMVAALGVGYFLFKRFF